MWPVSWGQGFSVEKGDGVLELLKMESPSILLILELLFVNSPGQSRATWFQ